MNPEEEIKKIEDKTNKKFEALQSREAEAQVNQKRTRVNLKQNAKGMYQAEMTIEDYNKTNEEIVNDLIDLKKRVEEAIKSAE